MLSIFKWAARPVSPASGSVINHLTDLAASMDRVLGGLHSAQLLFGACGQMEQLRGS